MKDNKFGRYIFANPAACGGITKNKAKLLNEIALETNAELLGLNTKSAAEFDELIEKTVNDGDTVIFAGGDGTFHQGLNIVYTKKVTVGYIPFGTGNAAAYALSITKPGPLAALSPPSGKNLKAVLKKNDVRSMDLVLVTADCLPKETAGLFSSTGWCAQMAGSRGGKGLAGYMIPAVKSLTSSYYEQDTKIYADNKLLWNGPNTLAIVTKSKFYGAGLMVAPAAVIDDEHLDLVVYNLSRTGVMTLLTTSFLGKDPSPALSVKAKEIRVESNSGKLPVQIDGEYYGESEKVSYRIIEKAIKVIHG
jgi:diacylglycerol kinase family enzyme